MRIYFTNKHFLLTISLAAIMVAGCSGGGGEGSAGSSCVPIHDGDVKWTYENCGPLTNGQTVDIRGNTEGDASAGSGSGFSKEALGERSANKGRVTFNLTNVDYKTFPWPVDDAVLIVFMGYGQYYREANWHMLGLRFKEWGHIETKFVSQRFDGICIPEKIEYCEKRFTDFDKPLYTGSATYKFDCSWDTTKASQLYGQGPGVVDGMVECKIYSVSGGRETLLQTYVVPTSGPYMAMNYFSAGGKTGGLVGKPDINSTLTNFRFTLFQD